MQEVAFGAVGCAFPLGRCGLVEVIIERYAAYLDSWLQVLRNDLHGRAACGRTFEYILRRETALLATAPPAASKE
ncbi:hypothetical protein [Variovorax sp. DT-64]|uniref:hypothetical protein n=1 Tax=Variovorax sp. DT-64 TaxID=3396160 RepID=UPI003F1B011F